MRQARVRPSARWWSPTAVFTGVLLLACTRAFAGGAPAGKECEFGIAVALAGKSAQAESVFISVLSHSPGSPAALTNLGNLRLLAGEPEVALSFYDRALAADTSDAGIVLNQAAALLALGEDDAAQERAHLGIEMAGGTPGAAALLGLHAPTTEGVVSRGAEASYLSKEEVLAMLRAAAGRVPADSARSPDGPEKKATRARRRVVSWRPAGPRSAEAQAQPMLVYWKR
jgi:tetratricopeptide (TPR) repeat protein